MSPHNLKIKSNHNANFLELLSGFIKTQKKSIKNDEKKEVAMIREVTDINIKE
jgi:hypothetical protein